VTKRINLELELPDIWAREDPRLIIFTEEAGPPRYFVTVVLRRELWYKNRWLSVAQMSYWFIIGDRGLTKNQCRSDDDYYCD
jgi:hypothetical protein